jgi:hypothetical protein
MTEMGDAYKVLAGKSEGRVRLEDLGIGRKITLARILKVQGERFWTGFIWLESGIKIGLKQGIPFINIQY